MDDDFFTNHGRRNLFDDKAKAQQIEELKAAYVREGRKLDRKMDERREEIRQLESRLQQLEQKQVHAKQNDELAEVQKSLNRNRRSLERMEAKRAAMPENERLGIDAIQTARVWKEPDGTIVIEAKVAPPQPRLKYEHENRCGLESRGGYEKAHARGAGSGFECDCGILYAPRELNQIDQCKGIERFMQERYRDKPAEVDLWVTTEVKACEGTSELQSASYTMTYVHRQTKREIEPFTANLEGRKVADTHRRWPNVNYNPYQRSISEVQEQKLRDAVEANPKLQLQQDGKSQRTGQASKRTLDQRSSRQKSRKSVNAQRNGSARRGKSVATWSSAPSRGPAPRGGGRSRR